jgi:uncharacterized RDD family membrane protein YckC
MPSARPQGAGWTVLRGGAVFNLLNTGCVVAVDRRAHTGTTRGRFAPGQSRERILPRWAAMTAPNPYAPPTVSLEPVHVDPPLGHSEKVEADLASFGQRAGNFIIDQVVVGSLVKYAIGAIPPEWLEPWDLTRAGLKAFGVFLNIGFFVAYYCVLEGFTGRTVGKWITRTRVVGLEGERATFGRIMARTLARFLPFDAMSFLFADAGWHDRLSRTRVVRAARKESAPVSVLRVARLG